MASRASQHISSARRLDYEAVLRYGLATAEDNDKQLITWARSHDQGAMAATQESLREIARPTDPQGQSDVANRDHLNAEYWLRSAETDADSPQHGKSQLIKAAGIVGAEPQVSRNFSYASTQPRIFEFVKMANAQVLGYCLGRLRGLVSFAAEAAAAYGTSFDGSYVKQDGWRLYPGAGRKCADSFSRSAHFAIQLTAVSL